MDVPKQIAALLLKQLSGSISASEKVELDEWINSSDNNRLLLKEINHQQIFAEDLVYLHPDNLIVSRQKLIYKIKDAIKSTSQKPYHRVHFLKTAWFRYAAAILILGTCVALYYTFSDTSQSDHNVVQTVPSSRQENVLPGFNRAVLTLSNGQQVELDSSASEIIKDGNQSIENYKGQLRYKNDGVFAMNTMSTPKGGQYKLTLADGTKVWLNAASSITYPTTFTKNTRKVTVTGEVYFEVAGNSSKPFIVKTYKDEIQVLGTQFNVNAYVDESTIKTSLIEGSVKVNDKILRPGEAYSNGNVTATDLQQDIAWKRWLF